MSLTCYEPHPECLRPRGPSKAIPGRRRIEMNAVAGPDMAARRSASAASQDLHMELGQTQTGKTATVPTCPYGAGLDEPGEGKLAGGCSHADVRGAERRRSRACRSPMSDQHGREAHWRSYILGTRDRVCGAKACYRALSAFRRNNAARSFTSVAVRSRGRTRVARAMKRCGTCCLRAGRAEGQAQKPVERLVRERPVRDTDRPRRPVRAGECRQRPIEMHVGLGAQRACRGRA
jgi:hypothetical protein